MGLLRRLNRPHPKSLSPGERDFDSGSLLPRGEGLGMRAARPRIQQRLKSWLTLSLVSATLSVLPTLPIAQRLGLRTAAALAQNADNSSDVLLEVEGTLEAGDATLDDGTFYDEYTFAGQAGETVSITLESLAFDTYLLLLDEQGERQIGRASCRERV